MRMGLYHLRLGRLNSIFGLQLGVVGGIVLLTLVHVPHCFLVPKCHVCRNTPSII